MDNLPQYYSSLAPFRELFLGGRPILTYHHVGSRPRGARLKGLYISPKLFARQLTELRAAGFSATDYAAVTAPGPKPSHCVFLTFDDGFCDVFEHVLPMLGQYGSTGIIFLVSGLLGKTNKWQQEKGDVLERIMDEVQVRDWLAAGHLIGAHTQTHPHLTQLEPAVAREEIYASKKSLEDRFGVRIEHFCYPYGDWNESVRDLVREAGYRTACTTQRGINTDTVSAYELKRLTARYPSRSLKAMWSRFRVSRS